jgi:hypothetical protein
MLIPRQAAINKLTHVNKTIISLYALMDAQTKAEVRGKKRVTIAETEPLTVCCNLYNLPIIQLVEKNPQMPPCCEQMAALLVENNPQMPPCSTSGGITGRKKSTNATVVY